MTAPISSISGLISGFDSRDLVDAIIAQARVPAARMEADLAALRAQTTALGTYRGLLDALRSAAQTLRSGSAFDATSATTTVVTGTKALASVVTTPEASAASFNLTVDQLARAEKLTGAGMTEATLALGLSGTFTVNGQDVVVSATDTLADIRDRINALNTGATPTQVSATMLSVSATDHRLILTSTVTGAIGISLSETAGTALQDLGFLDAGGVKLAGAITTSGADAQFRIDGTLLVRTSNVVSDAIQGVTLTLTSEEAGATTAITIGRFGDAAKAAMQQFVEAYNGLVTFLKAQGAADDTNRPALYGDALIRSARSALPSLLLTEVFGAAADLATVARAGLSLTRDGLLNFESATFEAAFNTRYTDLRRLFTEQLQAQGAGLSLVASGANPTGGAWDVEVTALATRATLSSADFGGSYDDGGTADTLTITESLTGRSVEVPLVTGMTATDIQVAVQQALDAEGLGIVADLDGQVLRLTTAAYGAYAGIQIAVSGTGDGSGELFSAPATASGTDIAGTIGGNVAIGSGQMLVGSSGTPAAGLSVRYVGAELGAVGSVSATIGAGARVERLLDTFLNSGDGMLAVKEARMQDRAARLQTRIDALDARLARRREVLLRSFLQMETSLARLQQQSSALLRLSSGNQDR